MVSLWAHKTTLSTDARLTLRWKNDTGFDKHMCNVSISNKTTEAFEFLTATIENMELKHRGPLLTNVLKSQSTRGSKIFGNGQKPYLKLCLLKASHEQVIKSTLFCLLILMWSRDRQFKFDPPGSNFGSKTFPKITNFACFLSKQTLANHKSNYVSLLNWPSSL